MTLTVLSPWMLLLAPLVLLPLVKSRPAALPSSSLAPYAALPAGWRERLSRWQPVAAILALTLLILALAEPALEQSSAVTLRRGVNLMLALDISASMRADDIKPNRIAVAREAAADFMQKRRDDNIGVILFSGVPYLLAPPTTDPDPVIGRLRQIEPDRLGSGTAIGDALAAATARLPERSARRSAVILMTDGTSNRGRLTPLAAARAAAALGVRVYTIGFGSEEGTLLPTGNGHAPQPVRLDEMPLRQIAQLTGGAYFRATDAGELGQVYRQIDTLEKSDLEVRRQVERQPLQPLLLTLTALLVGLELLLYRIFLRRLP